jgi:hypothetical protein
MKRIIVLISGIIWNFERTILQSPFPRLIADRRESAGKKNIKQQELRQSGGTGRTEEVLLLLFASYLQCIPNFPIIKLKND